MIGGGDLWDEWDTWGDLKNGDIYLSSIMPYEISIYYYTTSLPPLKIDSELQTTNCLVALFYYYRSRGSLLCLCRLDRLGSSFSFRQKTENGLH